MWLPESASWPSTAGVWGVAGGEGFGSRNWLNLFFYFIKVIYVYFRQNKASMSNHKK